MKYRIAYRVNGQNRPVTVIGAILSETVTTLKILINDELELPIEKTKIITKTEV